VKKYIFVLMLICLTVSACAPNEESRSLVGSWMLTAHGPVDSPTPAVPDVDAILTFSEDGSVAGSTGCNEFGGDYTVEGDQITFGQIVSTLILCPDLQMAQEETMYQVLVETASFNIEGDTLTNIKNDTALVFPAVASGS
jgi:heat shock protein HslJ